MFFVDNENMMNRQKLIGTLCELHKAGRTGILRFQHETAKKQMVLASGRIAFAESNVAEEHLARVMISMGLLNRSALNEIASSMKTGKTSEEAVLGITENDRQLVERGRRAQAAHILASVLAWENCDVGFYTGTRTLRNQVNLELSIPELIVEAARSVASNRLVSMPADLVSMQLCVEKDKAAADFPLNSSEARAYSLVCATAGPADMASQFPQGKDALEQSLSVLSILGLIKIQSRPISGSGSIPAQGVKDLLVLQLEEMLVHFENSGFYEILSVAVDAPIDEIQAAYHQLARRFHPDRFQSKEFPDDVHAKAERLFTYINKAYVTLKDPSMRAAYDEELKGSEGGKTTTTRNSNDARTAGLLYREGRAALARGEFEKAVEHLKAAVWLCPDKASYHHFLGIAESENPKSLKNAEEHFLKAIELEVFSVASRIALARLYFQVNLKRKAERLLKEVLQLDSENEAAKSLLQSSGASDSNRAGRHGNPLFP